MLAAEKTDQQESPAAATVRGACFNNLGLNETVTK